MKQVPASLSRGELENHNSKMGCKATKGNVLCPDQFSLFGGHRIKAAYELVFALLKVHCHLVDVQSSTQLVDYNAVVIVVLATGAGVFLRGLP